MVQLEGETEISRLKSALSIIRESYQDILAQAEKIDEQNYKISEQNLLKLKGHLQFLSTEFEINSENQK